MISRIDRIEVWPFNPAFKAGPYVMSHVTQQTARGRILSVRCDDGARGLGEIVFAPSLPPEVVQTRITDEAGYLRSLIGRESAALAALVQDLKGRDSSWRGIAFGLETALLDLQARSCDRSLGALLGGPSADSVADYLSVSEPSPDQVRRRIAAAGPEHEVIQLKVGIASLSDDHAQITTALRAMTGRQKLLADANGAWSRAQARSLMARFDDPRLVWEEPCRSYGDNAAMARESGKPVLVDQCVGDRAAAIAAIEGEIVAGICIKPAFLGGLSAAREVRDLAAAANMPMRIDGPWCGDVATAAILHLASGAPPGLLIAGCDLREPLAIETTLEGAVARGGGRIAPSPGPGLGIALPPRGLGDPVAVYR